MIMYSYLQHIKYARKRSQRTWKLSEPYSDTYAYTYVDPNDTRPS